MTAAAVLTVVGVIAIVSTFAIPDHRHRKLLVGSVSLGVSIALYASPLVAMVSHVLIKRKQRIEKTKERNRVDPS